MLRLAGYSSHSRCHPSSCIFAVLATFLVSTSAISPPQNVPEICHLLQLQQIIATLSPGLLGCRPFLQRLSCINDVILSDIINFFQI